MRVVFIAAECEPWAKTGGLGDVVDALARAVGRIPGGLSAPVDVFLPRYRTMSVPESRILARRPVRIRDTRGAARATPFPTDLTGGDAGPWLDVELLDVAGDGYRLRLVDCPAAFDREAYYGPPGGDYPDNAWRFSLLCRAALAAITDEGGGVDLLHLHDWHTSPVLLLRDGAFGAGTTTARMAVLLTVHNLAYHGWVAPERVSELGPDVRIDAPGTGLDLLGAAIERAELVNTVSPGFAAEALRPEYGMGLDGALRAKGDRFIGILNGVDTEVWNPATDTALAAPYDALDRDGKAACRAALLESIGFDPADAGPVLAMIGRLDPQKGFDLLAGAAESLLAMGARLVVLGSGDPALADPFRRLAALRPRQVALLEGFDRALARRLYAGADLFVMPSRFEPCGQGQMIALRYGTPPIVRRTGGLADTVLDVTEQPEAGTGFVFDEPTADALAAACARAIAVHADGAAWARLVERGMALDFGWERGPAQAYLAAYGRAVALRRGRDADAAAPPRPPVSST